VKKTFLLAFLIVVVAVVVLLLFNLNQSKIVVGIDNNPPYTFTNQPRQLTFDDSGMIETANGKTVEYQGFDIDVITIAAKKAGIALEFRELPFAELLQRLSNKPRQAANLFQKYIFRTDQIELAIGGISVTDKRKQLMDFTIPYATGGACIVTFAEDNIDSAEALAGKTVGVELATTMVDQAGAIKGAKIKGYNNQQDMFVDLIDGTINAIVMDKMSAEYYVKDRKLRNLRIVDMHSREEFAMVLRKGNFRLADKLNKALTAMKQSGELQNIYDKWFKKP